MTRLPAHALLVTYLTDALSARHITVEHLADLLAPIPEVKVRSWIVGTAAPEPDDLLPLALALHIHPVELIAGWMIDQAPEIERAVRHFTLDSLGSSFPRSSDLALRAPRSMPNMKVPDPHDEGVLPTEVIPRERSHMRKRASGAR